MEGSPRIAKEKSHTRQRMFQKRECMQSTVLIREFCYFFDKMEIKFEPRDRHNIKLGEASRIQLNIS